MYFIAFLGHFEVKILKKYVKFCENSQSTNILPQIWLKVQILFPPPCPGIFVEYIPLTFLIVQRFTIPDSFPGGWGVGGQTLCSWVFHKP